MNGNGKTLLQTVNELPGDALAANIDQLVILYKQVGGQTGHILTKNVDLGMLPVILKSAAEQTEEHIRERQKQ